MNDTTRGDRTGPEAPGSLTAVRATLDQAEGLDSVGALPYLRHAADQLAELIDEAMATAVLSGQASLRGAGAKAGLTENAVGPRLARTRSLAAYADERGRVTAAGVERAKYDLETGQQRQPAATPAPMRFKPRRTT
ncbi:hypothetical protein ASE01_07250 [Nocardioides sp. Root190]|uniref:hypothetical protein n=1 Tax=Nocardioides sp. Root190 TaxID=1736488 RepID=UPI0006FCE212|nr:hypothetical protein [Nocardioides sp. Root190]KRB77966.1 hypothetical protein ASE01_07250 [Nocardioides sp. Root190]